MEPLSDKLQNIWQEINLKIVQVTGWVLLFGVFGIVFNVVMRRIFHSSIMGVVELSEYLLVYVCWLGLAWILSVKGHVSVNILDRFLSPRRKIHQSIFTDIVGLIYCLISLWLTWNEAWIAFKGNLLFYGELGIVPQFSVLVVIPIGFALASIQLFLDLRRDVIALRAK